MLAARGVLWVPDFVVNAGGIVNIAVEFSPGGYDEVADGRRAIATGARAIERGSRPR